AVTVNVAATSTSLGVSANPAVVGQTLTLTASISNTAGAVTGSVMFFDGQQVLGTVAVVGGVATLDVSTFAVGHHSLTASYSGDTNHFGSGSAAVDQVINPITTTTTLASSAAASVVGRSVTFTATVAGTMNFGGMPSGTVSF